jgi:hypothetical protein
MKIVTTVEVGSQSYRAEANSFELHEEKMGDIQRVVEYDQDPSELYHQGVDDSLTEIE